MPGEAELQIVSAKHGLGEQRLVGWCDWLRGQPWLVACHKNPARRTPASTAAVSVPSHCHAGKAKEWCSGPYLVVLLEVAVLSWQNVDVYVWHGLTCSRSVLNGQRQRVGAVVCFQHGPDTLGYNPQRGQLAVTEVCYRSDAASRDDEAVTWTHQHKHNRTTGDTPPPETHTRARVRLKISTWEDGLQVYKAQNRVGFMKHLDVTLDGERPETQRRRIQAVGESQKRCANTQGT